MTQGLPNLALNRKARIEVTRIGQERQPVIIVDDALEGADALCAYAETADFHSPPEGAFYPGRMAHLPGNYLPVLLNALRPTLTQVFGMPHGALRHSHGFFGLTTQSSADMTPRQAIPHTDSGNLHSFATVHYLRGDFGGTAFFRHKATGFEAISNVESHPFGKLRLQEIADRDGQATDTLITELYEEIFCVEPVFNRLVVYRANQLHSARVENAAQLTDDARTGRLTANTFHNTRS